MAYDLCLVKLKDPLRLGDHHSYDVIYGRLTADDSSPIRGTSGASFFTFGVDLTINGSPSNIGLTINTENISWIVYETADGAIDALIALYQDYPYFYDLT